MRRLRVVLDRLPALIGYWDCELRNVIANQAYVEYFGITPEEALGRHIRDILGETVYDLNLPYIRGALAGEEQLFERTLIDQRGVTRYTQASYLPDIVDGHVQGFYVQVTDVTARVEAEHARDEAQRLFQISMANAPFGKAVLTTSAQTLQINPALCELLGYPAEMLIGSDFREFVHPEDRPFADADLAGLRDQSVRRASSERRYVRRDGTTIWMQRNVVLVPGAYGGEDVIVAQFQDVTGRRHAEAELARLALTDPLTGLSNRHALTKRLGECRDGDPAAEVGIVFVDLDGFKEVNDIHGHSTGDAVLAHAAHRLASMVQSPSSAYRLGGDEFVVLIPHAVAGDVEAFAAVVRTTLTGQYPTATAPVHLAASVGWTCGVTEDVDVLLRQADADMYRQKSTRRKRALDSDHELHQDLGSPSGPGQVGSSTTVRMCESFDTAELRHKRPL
jgi:diguanylate cyclase (GGDEF)-like protein/PAS domain S-box-containing protein